jgi:hypothetical protein
MGNAGENLGYDLIEQGCSFHFLSLAQCAGLGYSTLGEIASFCMFE